MKREIKVELKQESMMEVQQNYRVGYDGGEEDYFVCRECGASSTRRFGEVRR